MTEKRSDIVGNVFPTRKQPDGTYLCSVCGGPMPSRRCLRYCSNACRDIAYVATSPSYARYKVELRDKGICAACGCDTDRLHRILRIAGLRRRYADRPILVADRLEGMAIMREMGFKTNHLWEMDHTVAIVEGGRNEMANLRTLCVPCHRADTKELAGRRAEMKRTMPLFAEKR